MVFQINSENKKAIEARLLYCICFQKQNKKSKNKM